MCAFEQSEKGMEFKMEIYDTANRLAEEIRNSVQYKALKQSKETLLSIPEKKELIEEFEKLTGCAVLVNTSFNVRGEPIVCSIDDAYTCFMRTDMDVLVIEDYIFIKEEQPELKDDKDWRLEYELD